MGEVTDEFGWMNCAEEILLKLSSDTTLMPDKRDSSGKSNSRKETKLQNFCKKEKRKGREEEDDSKGGRNSEKREKLGRNGKKNMRHKHIIHFHPSSSASFTSTISLVD